MILNILIKKFKNLDSLPSKDLSLFFLFVALFYFYFDISWASTTQQIRNDQEIFEFLLSSGIFLHSLKNLKNRYNAISLASTISKGKGGMMPMPQISKTQIR